MGKSKHRKTHEEVQMVQFMSMFLRSSVMSQVMIEQPWPFGFDSSAPAKTSVTLSFRQINGKKNESG